ncbi:MAG: cytochrome c [Hyphomicrobiales bacterium]|nr:cytochrome c [Hyphomicrobiales bacterium]MDE2114136.1 cytochrome c [Hyphomicrobiales bacterium]
MQSFSNSRWAAALFATLALGLVPLPVQAQTTLTLKTSSVDLPDPLHQFKGEGADAVNNNCLACHSAEMIQTQPKLNAATWTAEVNKMINVMKAPVDKADVAAIVNYLVANYGTK